MKTNAYRSPLALIFALGLGPLAAQEALRETPSQSRLIAPASAGLTAAQELAQSAATTADSSAAAVWSRSVGLQPASQRTAGAGVRLLGGGPDYRADFFDGGFALTPAFGREAPRDFPLAFRLESVRRGDALVSAATGGAKPTADGIRVAYEHAGVSERYELRTDGVYQSFVFDEPPAGAGDLVVSGLLETDLVATPNDGGLVFSAPGVGELSYGGVVGIDADGRRADGSLSLVGSRIELALPAAFVDAATYPLTLDPLVGGVITVASSNDESDPDVAYDFTEDAYLVVWERAFSGSTIEIRCQRVGADGTLFGGTIFLTGGSGVKINPTVADVNLSNKFLVAWQEGSSIFGPWDIKGATVAATNGAISAGTVTIADDVNSEIDPDASGEAGVSEDDALVVWNRVNGGIRGAQVTVPSSAIDPFVVNTFTITTSASASKPAISKSGGPGGRHLVAYQLWFSTPAPGDHDLRVAAVDRNGAILAAPVSVLSSQGPNEEHVDVDGDGDDNFMLVWDREAGLGSGDRDIHCKTVRYETGSLIVDTFTEVIVEGDANDDEREPCVGWAGGKYMVGWLDAAGALTYDVYAVGLGPDDCEACENQLFVDGGFGAAALELAAQRSGSTAGGDGLLLVYEAAATSPPFISDLLARRLEAFGEGGVITNAGGGCGGGGTISALGPAALGNPDFAIQLTGADPGASIAILNLLSQGPAITCGPCTWNPFRLTFVQTLNAGTATQVLPVPCTIGLLGATVPMQWTVANTASSPCSLVPNASASDILMVGLGS